MANFPDTWRPYRKVKRDPIQYTYCVDYDHICRYRALRQVIHQGQSKSRYIGLETTNAFKTYANMRTYTVPSHLENRLDIIARDQLGSAEYAWVIAYINKIPDGFTVLEETQLKIPNSITDLFNKGELLESIPATKINLGSE